MNTDDARTIVLELLHAIAPEAPLDELDPDALLLDEIEMDSMDFLNFVTALHERTGVAVPERDYPQLATVNGCVGYLSDRAA